MEILHTLIVVMVPHTHTHVKTHPTVHLKLLNFIHLTYTSIKLV